jgi:hypothetical protein
MAVQAGAATIHVKEFQGINGNVPWRCSTPLGRGRCATYFYSFMAEHVCLQNKLVKKYFNRICCTELGFDTVYYNAKIFV